MCQTVEGVMRRISTEVYVENALSVDCHGCHEILQIDSLSLCMTYLSGVLRRCRRLPDPSSSWEKSVCGENGCQSVAAIAVLLSRRSKNVEKIHELFWYLKVAIPRP